MYDALPHPHPRLDPFRLVRSRPIPHEVTTKQIKPTRRIMCPPVLSPRLGDRRAGFADAGGQASGHTSGCI